jgi:hypothetical protein
LKENALPLPHYKKIWKILFFALWDADKTKVQNTLSDQIAQMIHSLQLEVAYEWIRAAFHIL